MAAKKGNKITNFLSLMVGGLVQPDTIGKVTLDTDGQISLSDVEKKAAIKRISELSTPTSTRTGLGGYEKYIKPLVQSVSRTKLDNEHLRVLAPEIKVAERIVIPSILSPTDLKDGKLNIFSASKLVDSETNAKISEILHTHFNDVLKISSKLPEWIRESLYGAGSKPLLVLPITELDIIMNDPEAVMSRTVSSAYSTEVLNQAEVYLQNLDDLDTVSIFGLADSSNKPVKVVAPNDQKTKNENTPSFVPSVESLVTEFITSNFKGGEDTASYNRNVNLLKEARPEILSFAASALESISIVDNPDVIKKDKAKVAKKKAEITEKISVTYKVASLITVNPEAEASRGNPVVYELPPESVVPIFTPGTPTDHIGYFIALDEYGNPVHLSDKESLADITDNRRTTPGALYASFGFDKYYPHIDGSSSRVERDSLMVNIYQTIIDSHLQGRLKNNGIDNVYIGAAESVYRCMFARYLSARKTKLLFVPKDLLTYFCFNHNSDGTGRSQIEDIKFILSLKITLVICRMMASMNSSINRKTINIQFAENMGDPIQYMEMIKKEVIDKSLVSFTYDPTDITRSLAQKGLTVKAKGVPGADVFDVTTEPNDARDIRPDESLMELIDNLMILSLEVPPSAANLLSETEYSRSVATQNIFFSRGIAAKQVIVCRHVARHIQVYTHMSETLKASIRDLLKAGTKEQKDSGTTDSVSVEAKLSDIIKNIQTSLPSPDVAPNKAEFEELDSMITSLTTALESIFDNDLASDDPLPMMRALVKSDVVRDYMKRTGLTKDSNIPEFNTEFLTRILEWKQELANTMAGIATLKKSTTAPGDSMSDDTGSTGGPPSF